MKFRSCYFGIYFLPTSRQYNVVLPSQNRNLFLLIGFDTAGLYVMTNDRIFSLVLTVSQSADCLPEKLMFWVASLFKAGYIFKQVLYLVASFMYKL